MTIFDIISNILFTKKQSTLQSVDEESAFVPYILNRWLSMHSPTAAETSNVINKYIGLFDTKQELYQLFYHVFPRFSFKKINYIKKKKPEIEENSNTKNIAQKLELSQREILQYIDFLKT